MSASAKFLEKHADLIVALVAVGLIIAGAVYSLILGNELRYWDENEYYSVSKNLRLGMFSLNGENPTAFSAPGYPILLYMLSWIIPQIVFLRFFNFIFLGVNILLIYFLIKKNFSAAAGALTAIVIAIYPLFFYTAGTLYSQTAGGLFLIICIYLITLNKPSRQYSLGILSGLIFGYLVLISPSFLLFLAVLCLYPWILKYQKRWKTAIVFIIAAIIPLSCWSIRNYLVFDRFILVSTNSGINLLLGNSENTRPNSGVNVDLSKYMGSDMPEMDEYELDKYYRNLALKWMRENPGDALWLYVKKVVNYFNFRNELATKHEKSHSRDDVVFITYYPLLFLFFLRLCLFKKYPIKPFESLLIILYLSSPFLLAIFFTRIRFRIPFDYLMIMVAVPFAVQWMTGRENSTQRTRYISRYRKPMRSFGIREFEAVKK